jgi:hypothetical protein
MPWYDRNEVITGIALVHIVSDPASVEWTPAERKPTLTMKIGGEGIEQYTVYIDLCIYMQV